MVGLSSSFCFQARLFYEVKTCNFEASWSWITPIVEMCGATFSSGFLWNC